jgi:hypothetical protein
MLLYPTKKDNFQVAREPAESEKAQNAFIEHLFNQVVKEPMRAYGEEEMERLRQAMVASQFNVRNLMVDIATVSALHGVGKAAGVGVASLVAGGHP